MIAIPSRPEIIGQVCLDDDSPLVDGDVTRIEIIPVKTNQ